MHIGVCTIRFEVPGSTSLKEKRQVVQSIKDRARRQFNIAIAEVGNLDSRDIAELAIACISNEARHVNSTLSTVANFIEEEFPISVLDVQIQLL